MSVRDSALAAVREHERRILSLQSRTSHGNSLVSNFNRIVTFIRDLTIDHERLERLAENERPLPGYAAIHTRIVLDTGEVFECRHAAQIKGARMPGDRIVSAVDAVAGQVGAFIKKRYRDAV